MNPPPHSYETILDGDWDPDAWWSTTNHGEAVPGVITPLNWSFWGTVGERARRQAFVEIGALEEERGEVPADSREWVLGIFHGRVAGKVNFLGEMGDRLPGITGAEVAAGIVGTLPEDFPSAPTEHRLEAIAARFPELFAALPDRVNALGAETRVWWSAEVQRAPTLPLADAQALWRTAQQRFEVTLTGQIVSIFAGVQPVFGQVHALAAAAGDLELASRMLQGQGSHAELTVVEDHWDLSRDEITLDEFLARHGYHGPAEGEMSSFVWREDPTAVVNIAEQYRTQPDSEGPAAVASRHADVRAQARQALLDATPESERAAALDTLALADRYVPLRGVGKVAFLQGLDVARAASRRIGQLLAEDGVLESPGDVFYLTANELLAASHPASLATVVAERKQLRAGYQQLELPSSWRGRPDVTVAVATERDPNEPVHLAGVGASPGVIEGPVRVITDPTFADVEPGEILVAPLTDPSWASIMYCSAALVVDVGGPLSHAAIVARELGLPCVMGLGDATSRLRTGDICRVDGQAGTVEVLQFATTASS